MLPHPLRETALPRPITVAAARVRAPVTSDSTIASEFNITNNDMESIYVGPQIGMNPKRILGLPDLEF